MFNLIYLFYVKEQNKHRVVDIFLCAYFNKRTSSSPASAERAETRQRIMGCVNLNGAH